jgi:hypothetical protein
MVGLPFEFADTADKDIAFMDSILDELALIVPRSVRNYSAFHHKTGLKSAADEVYVQNAQVFNRVSASTKAQNL